MQSSLQVTASAVCWAAMRQDCGMRRWRRCHRSRQRMQPHHKCQMQRCASAEPRFCGYTNIQQMMPDQNGNINILLSGCGAAGKGRGGASSRGGCVRGGDGAQGRAGRAVAAASAAERHHVRQGRRHHAAAAGKPHSVPLSIATRLRTS